MIIYQINEFHPSPTSSNHASWKKSPLTKVTVPRPILASRTGYSFMAVARACSVLHASIADCPHSSPYASYPKLARRRTSTPRPQPGTRAFLCCFLLLSGLVTIGLPRMCWCCVNVSSSAGLGTPLSQLRLSPRSHSLDQPCR